MDRAGDQGSPLAGVAASGAARSDGWEQPGQRSHRALAARRCALAQMPSLRDPAGTRRQLIQIADAHIRVSLATVMSEGASGSGVLRVLVVGDDPLLAEGIASVLIDAGPIA